MGTQGTAHQAALVQAVRSSALLGRLPGPQLADLLGDGRIARVEPDETIRRAGDDVVGVILDGVAIGSQTSDEGPEVITDILGPGSAIGLPVVLGHLEAGADATALTTTEVLRLPGRELRRKLTEHPALARACLSAALVEISTLRSQLARFAYTSTTERVVYRLLELAAGWGEQTDHGIVIRIPLTQEMLASWARASRESTAKVLSDLRQAQIIRTARRELIVLDPDGLARRCPRNHDHGDDLLRELLQAIG
jgi:CRP/FNR family transcriptional regulator, cyclic AMP receptor protein